MIFSFSGTCHEWKDCRDKEKLSIAIIIIIMVAAFPTIVAVVCVVLACCGCFKRKRFAGVIVANQPQEQQAQIASSDYVQLDNI